jgi:lysophospholipase L1-like esterase
MCQAVGSTAPTLNGMHSAKTTHRVISSIMHKLVAFLLLASSIASSQPPSPLSLPTSPDSIIWYAVSNWGVEGRGWSDVKRFYDRLPAKAEGVVREKVWDLSHHSAGMSCRFTTDAPEIQVRYTLLFPRLEMPHMPATGVSGVDLYTLLDDGQWRWIGTVQPTQTRVFATIIQAMTPERRTYMLYLPLYNGIDSLEIGVTRNAVFEPIEPRPAGPIVFYGTSIMHGACASRPGMAIPAILGRRLNVPIINLGFSGNGKMEPEVGSLLSELDASVFVLDCLPNLTPQETAERAEPFVRHLREAKPTTPILLVEDRVFPNAVVQPDRLKGHQKRHVALREAYERLITSGLKDLYYLEGDGLLGEDGEATVDGSHPTDLGMMRYADAYEKVLRIILNGR